MPQRPPSRPSAPAEVLRQLNGGVNGYTDPTLTDPKQWSQAVNCFSGQFGFIQRARFANLHSFTPATGQAFKTFKYYAIPGTGAYLLGDLAGKLWSFDTSTPGYTKTQRFNNYIDPAGTGSSQLNGPWSREILQNIVYEMNGLVKQSGRGQNGVTIEGFGLDAPDASPQVTISSGATEALAAAPTGAVRSNGIVTLTTTGTNTIGAGFVNVTGVTDTSFNGTFFIISATSAVITYAQAGQNATSGSGTVDNVMTKSIGRSYAWAWENANKPHVSAPSPSTQFIQYNSQNGLITLTEPGTVATTSGSAVVTGTGTQFTSAWVGRSLWTDNANGFRGARVISVQSATQMTMSNPAANSISGLAYQIYDPQATHIRLYDTGDGGATYFRTQRNAWAPNGTTAALAGLTFNDNANSEPPNFPFTSETSQINNLPPPIGPFLNEYQNRLLVYGIQGANQTFFYSNIETTNIGLAQESFAPLNQVTLPIANGSINGMIEFPGSLIIWSDKQDMFRLTGLLTDNVVSSTGTQQGTQISRLPYAIGCASPFAADISPLGGMWITSNAEIMLYTDKYAPRNVGQPVQDILNSISPGNLNLSRAKYFHANKRNWMVFSVAANGSSFCNTLLVCDLDLLASNGAPSYFTFDMATNSPVWYVLNVGPVVSGSIIPRSDSIEVVYQPDGRVRLLTGGVDLIQDADFRPGSSGTEIQVPGATVKTHSYGNDTPFIIKRPSFVRFDTASDPSLLAALGWSFAVEGIDDDYYTFAAPLVLNLTPGVNDTSSLCGNPNLSGGESFRHSPCLYRIGGVNFVAGRRLRFQVNFPSQAGDDYQFQSVQLGFGPSPPR